LREGDKGNGQVTSDDHAQYGCSIWPLQSCVGVKNDDDIVEIDEGNTNAVDGVEVSIKCIPFEGQSGSKSAMEEGVLTFNKKADFCSKLLSERR
jgi:hypothetical protein